MRCASSGPWQAKHLAERMGEMSRAKSTFAAALPVDSAADADIAAAAIASRLVADFGSWGRLMDLVSGRTALRFRGFRVAGASRRGMENRAGADGEFLDGRKL